MEAVGWEQLKYMISNGVAPEHAHRSITLHEAPVRLGGKIAFTSLARDDPLTFGGVLMESL